MGFIHDEVNAHTTQVCHFPTFFFFHISLIRPPSPEGLNRLRNESPNAKRCGVTILSDNKTKCDPLLISQVVPLPFFFSYCLTVYFITQRHVNVLESKKTHVDSTVSVTTTTVTQTPPGTPFPIFLFLISYFLFLISYFLPLSPIPAPNRTTKQAGEHKKMCVVRGQGTQCVGTFSPLFSLLIDQFSFILIPTTF